MAQKVNSLICLVLAGAAAMFAAPTAARAQFRSGFVGWTGMADNARDGLVNFAVYRTIDSDWTNDFTGTSASSFTALSGPLDTSTFEVLFFQVVNTDPDSSGDTIDRLLVGDPLGLVTSTGYISGRVFKDTASLNPEVGQTGNLVIGSETDPAPTPADTLDGVPTRSDRSGELASSPFASSLSSINPSSTDTGVSGFIRFNFSSAIGDGGFSSVFFVTTDDGPAIYSEGRTGNSGGFSSGDIPRPNPEPASMVLVLVGVLGYAGYSLKKSKQSRADDELQAAPVAI